MEEPLSSGLNFSFSPFSVQEVYDALVPRKPAGPVLFEPSFLKLAAELIAEALTYLFNLTLECREIPKIWKSAFVLPLLRGYDPTVINNYWPSSRTYIPFYLLSNQALGRNIVV